MKYALIQDPDDLYYAVWMRNSIGWHHLGQGWRSTQEQALRKFCRNRSSIEPRHVQTPSRLLQQMQTIFEFTVDSHPEYFI